VDITHDNVGEQVATVLQVLDDLGASERPIVTALNKIDRLPASGGAASHLSDQPNSVALSALTGEGMPELLARLEDVLGEELVEVAVMLPYRRGDLLGLFHQRGVIEREQHSAEGTLVWGKLPSRLAPRFQAYTWPPQEHD
jgi:GTP-binding protein HflX